MKQQSTIWHAATQFLGKQKKKHKKLRASAKRLVNNIFLASLLPSFRNDDRKKIYFVALRVCHLRFWVSVNTGKGNTKGLFLKYGALATTHANRRETKCVYGFFFYIRVKGLELHFCTTKRHQTIFFFVFSVISCCVMPWRRRKKKRKRSYHLSGSLSHCRPNTRNTCHRPTMHHTPMHHTHHNGIISNDMSSSASKETATNQTAVKIERIKKRW